MGILRTDVVSHSQLSNGNASVLFDGTTDSITIPSHSALAFGTADWTVEGWFYFTSLSGQQTLVGDTYGATAGWYLYKQNNHRLGVYYSSLLVDGNTLIEADRWYHLAFVRHSGRTSIYIDGELDAEAADTTNATITQYYIGDTADTSSGELFGYMSNLRITRTAVYTTEFTVPKFKLKEIPGTILLCCQSSSSTTEATVSVPGTLTTGGDPTATAFGPGLKDDITDSGVVFDGVTNFDSLAYFMPPSGKTTQRNRGRGIIPGGRVNGSTSGINNISFIEIQSQGIGEDFGDLTENVVIGSSFASSTRAVRGGGYVAPSDSGVYDFVTIASTGNAQDFGDLLDNRHWAQGGGNQTRGILAGGNGGGNSIEFVTIASTGNGSDFGDLINSYTTTVGSGNGAASPTRLLFAGGTLHPSPSATNIIQYVTIASTGNAVDFGDLTDNKTRFGVCSSETRGLYGGGGPGESDKTNTITFVTLASTGNSVDFGDRIVASNNVAATSNATRGVFIGGGDPSGTINTIDFVTISTTGSATDFGDNVTVIEHTSACSDSHGGIS